jgi:menaquinone-specific isochorismate synthase
VLISDPLGSAFLQKSQYGVPALPSDLLARRCYIRCSQFGQLSPSVACLAGGPRASETAAITMPSTPTLIRSGAGFHKDVFDVPGADPIRFLKALGGEPRGFWGRQNRWVAWGGALARIEVRSGSGQSRFDEVRAETRRMFRRIYTDWGSLPFRERPRLFGGFSFLEDGGLDPTWSGFPAAGFVLPRVILEASGDQVRFRVAGVTPWGTPGSDPETEELAASLLEVLSNPRPAGLPPNGHSGEPTSASAASDAPADRVSDVSSAGRKEWEESVRAILRAVEEGSVQKAVLARVLETEFTQPVDSLVSLGFLRSENRRAHVYLFEPHAGRTFLGAAPEVLAELRGGRLRATAVAGSIPRGKTDDEDQELARVLIESEKNRSEHDLTVKEMVRALDPRLSDMQTEDRPRVLALARIQHLETAISGTPEAQEDILSLVESLHPTPAVCGSPRDGAQVLIRSAEAFDRGWYAGPLGWFDLAGEGDFVPGLRAAIGHGRRWRLFAGAGIVAGSDPSEEWEETALKFEAALRALRVGAGESP